MGFSNHKFLRGIWLSFSLSLLLPVSVYASAGAAQVCEAAAGDSAEAFGVLRRSQTTGWIAIVDGVSSGKRYAEAARARGLKVLHISTYKDNQYPEMWAGSFDPEAYDALEVFDYDRPEALLDLLEAYGIQAIIPGCEEAPPVAEYLASQMGLLTNGFDHEDRLSFFRNPRRNKFDQNETVEAYLDNLKSQGVKLPGRVAFQIGAQSWNELYWWKKEIYTDWPVIAKPVMSSAQDSIFKCYDMACLKRAFEAIMGKVNKHGHVNEIVQVQEFLDGEEFIIETASAELTEGQFHHEFAYAWQYDAVPVEGTSALTHVADLLPVGHPLDPRFFEFAKILNEALGIRVGSAHYEMIKTVSGEIVLVETGPRMAGGDMPFWVREATGFDEVNLNLDAYLNPDLFFDRLALIRAGYGDRSLKNVSEVLLLSKRSDTISTHVAEPDIRALPSFRNISWRKPEGSPLQVSTNLENVIAYVILMHEDAEQLAEDRALLKQWEAEGRFSVPIINN